MKTYLSYIHAYIHLYNAFIHVSENMHKAHIYAFVYIHTYICLLSFTVFFV